MSITVPDTETKATDRQILAAIALAELPTPSEIQLPDNAADHLRLYFRTIADGAAWIRHLGGHDYVARHDGHAYLEGGRYPNIHPTWLGWPISFWAVEKDTEPVEDLDDATRTALTNLAGVSS